ncbi:MAG: cell division protein CrgA [Acidimicrobiia bacterium]
MAKGKGKNSGAASRNRPAAPKTTPKPGPETKPAEGGDTIGRIKPAADADKKPAGPRTRPAPTKRTTPPASARYTPPVPRSEKVSPLWVPILMFACLGLGMLTIILNYVNVLPGPDPSNVYLMIGLGLITVGFITATKYH